MTKLHVIPLGMVNVYLLEGQKNILVDTGVKKSEEKIFEGIKALGISPDAIDAILLTHGHADHIGSVSAIVAKTGAKVIMSEIEYKTLTEEIPEEVVPLNFLSKFIFAVSNIAGKKHVPPDFKPDILFKGYYYLNEFGIDGKAVPTPGHTKGSVTVLLNDGSAIIGDNLMALISKKKPSKPMLAYDINLVKKNIKNLFKLGAKRFYISHGGEYSKKTIEEALERL